MNVKTNKELKQKILVEIKEYLSLDENIKERKEYDKGYAQAYENIKFIIDNHEN